MYSPVATDRQIAAASTAIGFPLHRYSVQTCRARVDYFNDLTEFNDRGEALGWKRPLTAEETQYIRNERLVCKLDFLYYATRYSHIEDVDSKEIVLWTPNIAQLILIAIWGDAEERQWAIMLLELKARQLGVTTANLIAISHRVIFWRGTNAIMASSDPKKSRDMADKVELVYKYLPWWLMPKRTASQTGGLLEFKGIDSKLDIFWGNQKQGLSRGATPRVAHLSEIAEYEDATEKIDNSLLNAVHEHPSVFFVLEGTGKGKGDNYLYKTWQTIKELYPKGESRLRPLFLPVYVGEKDLYPTSTWLRMHPIPRNWQPEEVTQRYKENGEQYVANTPELRDHMGANWIMSREHMWRWEFQRREAIKKGNLSGFLQEWCVKGDTRISTPKGFVRIDSAQKVDEVETGLVSHWYDRGTKETVVIKTLWGRELAVTPEHLVALKDETWKAAGLLEPKDIVKLSQPVFSGDYYTAHWRWTPKCEMTVVIDELWGRFLGYFMGDGCFHNRDTVEVACDAQDVDVVEDVARIFEELTGKPATFQKTGGCVKVRSHSVRWFEIMNALGLIQPRYHINLGRNSGHKRLVNVPECIWRSPKSVVREFISALFECDGHAYKEAAQTCFFSCHKRFIEDVQLLLLGFGINSKISMARKKNGSGRDYVGRAMRLPAESSDAFHERIGFISHRKRTSGKRRPKMNAGRPRLPNEMTDVVVSVEQGTLEHVYDITVEESHAFGANGFLVHNCSTDLESFQAPYSNVFGGELIYEIQSKQKPPVAVYGIEGSEDEISSNVHPFTHLIDTEQEPRIIRVKHNDSIPVAEYRFVPLRLDGYPNTFSPLGKLLIFERPEDGEEYGLGVDPSYGKGKDLSAVEGLRNRSHTRVGAQVLEFASPLLDSHRLWPYVSAIGQFLVVMRDGTLQQPRMAIELAANGQEVQRELADRGWFNFHQRVPADAKTVDYSREYRLGFETTRKSRPKVTQGLERSIRDQTTVINSPWLLEECGGLIWDTEKERLEAAYGGHDDRYMALGIIRESFRQTETPTMRVMAHVQKTEDAAKRNHHPAFQRPDLARDVPSLWYEENEAKIESGTL